MHTELEKIQKRYDEYKAEYEKVLVDFHDSETLNLFNDRFGYDNPQAKKANRGIEIEKKLIEMKREIERFAEDFRKRFPEIN